MDPLPIQQINFWEVSINNSLYTKIMNKEELKSLWGAENTENEEITEEKKQVIQEVMHDDINSQKLT